jgi:hypothetical protein
MLTHGSDCQRAGSGPLVALVEFSKVEVKTTGQLPTAGSGQRAGHRQKAYHRQQVRTIVFSSRRRFAARSKSPCTPLLVHRAASASKWIFGPLPDSFGARHVSKLFRPVHPC